MSYDINRTIVVGRLASDVELKHTANGKSVGNFRLAVGGMPKPDGTDSVSFFNVVVWGKTADICQQYLAKGNKVCIDGRLDQRTWKAQDGGNRSTVEIVAERVEFLSMSEKKTDKPESDGATFYDDFNSEPVEPESKLF